ncbi:DUF3971 domain-containing protein [Rickettsiales bacterium]|nr:DUF3971 domain-containing protein [Rickettsiales bacterium]
MVKNIINKIYKSLLFLPKLIISILAIYLTSFIYFIIILSIEPRSIDFVTDKVNNIIQRFDIDVKVKKTNLEVDNFSNLKLTLIDFVNIGNNQLNIANIKIDNIKIDISLIDLFFLNYKKSKVTINDLSFDFLQSKEEIKNNKEFLLSNFINNNINKITKSNITNFNLFANNIAINYQNKINEEDKKDASNYEQILLKKSEITIINNHNKFQIVSSNNININNKIGLKFNLNCNANISSGDNINCNIFANDFNSKAIAKLSDNFSWLKNINALFDAQIKFKYYNNKVSDISFKISSQKGDFSFLKFFSDKINYQNLNALGTLSLEDNIINLSQINADLKSKISNNLDSKISMSLLISNFLDKEKSYNYDINLYNISNDELEKYWPISLPRQDIRKWVVDKFYSGVINHANASFKINYDGNVNKLESINSTVNLSNINLHYHDYFPQVKNISAIAKFDKNSMAIEITEGKILDSKIINSKVEIKNFFAKENILNISSQIIGPTIDLIKHIDYRSEFINKMDDIINGSALSEVNIDLPLKKKILLNDVNIAVNSDIENIDNIYSKGIANVKLSKEINSINFKTAINLDELKLAIPAFGIEKEPKIKSALTFNLKSKDNILSIDKINLLKIKDLRQFNGQVKKSIISGNIIIDQNLRLVQKLSLNNHNFGNNNYNISYNDKDNLKIIKASGTNLDLSRLINNKLPLNLADNQIKDLRLSIDITKAYLSNDKILSNFFVNLNCVKNFCNNGNIKANYGANKFLNINISKINNKKHSSINGLIYDIGYLARALNITNLIQGGDIKVKGKIELINNQNKITAKLQNISELTFFENEKIKNLTIGNNLFLKIRDIIFNKGKTKFDNIEADLAIYDQKLQIKSFIANNFKIGLTAKGIVDINNKSYNIKGMIIPGYTINNLFGIAKIPIVGNVVSGLLTGGDDDGGVFGIRYKFSKDSKYHKEKFTTEKIKSFVPSSINNLFDLLDG